MVNVSSMTKDIISHAIETVGLCALAKACNVTPQAIYKWQAKGRLPRTDWTGETDYASRIEEATGGRITRTQLLDLKATAETAASKPQQDMDKGHA